MSEENVALVDMLDDRIDIGEMKSGKADPNKESFLIINNYSQFASVDVWAGIAGAFRDLNHFVLPYPVHKMQAFVTPDIMYHYIVAMAISTRNNFTHVLFVGSAFIPSWVIKSIQRTGIKVIYWSVEDPHALDQNGKFYSIADYYMTNERNVKSIFPNAIYLPTAADHHDCMPPKVSKANLSYEDKKILAHDIVFCGNVYPNRQKLLEELIPMIEKKGYSFAIMGVAPTVDTEKDNPLKKYILREFKGIVDHRWLVMSYGYSKIALNIEREDTWEYDVRYSTNRIHKVKGESLNPRAYEIALCGGALQLIDNKRAEVFSEGIMEDKKHLVVYENVEDLFKKIEYYIEHDEERKQIVKDARNHVLENHTYLSRAIRILKAIRLKEGRKDQVIKDEMEIIKRKLNK